MNICLTTDSCPWSTSVFAGGGQIVTHNLAKQLSQMGHRVFVVYVTPEEITPPQDVNYEIIWVRDLGRYHNGLHGLHIFPVARAVHRLASRTDIDIIHGSGAEAALLHFVAKRNKRLFVMTIHRPYYPKLNSAKLLVRPDVWLWEHLCFFEWYAYTNAQKVFAVSNYAKAHVIANLGLRAEKIVVVYNGIASEFFAVRRENIPADGIKLFAYGRLEPQKGIDILLKSLALVLNSLKRNQKVHLTIAGSGPYQEEYEKLAENLGVSQNVSFIGWSGLAQLTQLLSEASLCVLPSRVESFGLTVGEAMAAGVPTISTNTSSIPEIITDGETGLLVPPEDPDALAERILYAINNPSEMNKVAYAGREKIRECFTWERIAEKYCATYGSLLNSG
jgi:glycosyltransferase involved in cell wall biosynthesis